MTPLSRLKKLLQQLKPQEPVRLRPELLLSPMIPEPMFGVAPRVVMGSKWWMKERREAIARSRRRCAACGDFRRRLEGHEVYDVDYLLGRMVYLETVALCFKCHSFIHRGRLSVLLGRGEIDRDVYDDIIAHGRRVLQEAGDGLKQKEEYVGPWADRKDWRLVIGDEEFPPLPAEERDRRR